MTYLEKEQEAEKILQKAKSLGLTQADILMVQGELARSSGRNEDAAIFYWGTFYMKKVTQFTMM